MTHVFTLSEQQTSISSKTEYTPRNEGFRVPVFQNRPVNSRKKS